ncbi:MAG: nucleotidyltransferase domain-containing protein [Bacteroidetes bacterium]|nr:nucleotidyltransferase domain-containing protein [Bacteroidota bacterium]
MKTSLEHLPDNKKEQINFIKDYIIKYSKDVPIEYIILFGSYSTGKWVENEYRDKYGWVHGHESDIDILVLTKYKRHADKLQHWSRLEDAIINKKSHAIMDFPSLTIIAHHLDFFNEMVKENYYFYVDILKEGTILYNSNNSKLSNPGKLTSEKVKEKAVESFEQWFKSASSFLDTFYYDLNKKEYKQASFQLHQAAERYYHWRRCKSLAYL